MDIKAAIIALLGAWGVGTAPALADTDVPIEAIEDDAGLVDRVWVRSDQPDLPGGKQIFLSDGTLVTDSCWEVYRLSEWRQVSPTEITWDEDGQTINAEIVSLSEDELVLRLALVSETVEQRYVPAEVPYVCPDWQE